VTSRSERLTAYLAAGAALPFVWGERDCCLWVSDWIKAERGLDPGGELRGAYADQRACARIVKRAGGLSALVSNAMAKAGLPETDAPGLGDVGTITAGGETMMAVCLGERWALKAKDGLAVIPATHLVAWSI
jgi:hypothetical protein